MVEYILVFVLLLGAVAGLGYLSQAVRSHSERTNTLLNSGYP